MLVQALCPGQIRYLLSFRLDQVGKFTIGCEKMGPQMNADLRPGLTYLRATGLEAEPPKLLRTVMLSGYIGHGSEALKRPLPLVLNVPTKAPVAVT